MSLTERLKEYYGTISPSVEKFLDKKVGYTENQLDEIYEQILITKSKEEGSPDIKLISEIFNQTKPKAQNSDPIYSCNICDICKTKYDYRMYYCPTCWKRDQKKVMAHSVLVSHTEIQGIVSYNKFHFSDQNLNDPRERKAGCKSCYFCSLEFKSRCDHFGNPKWTCHDADMCDCRSCCVSISKNNEELQYKIDLIKQKTDTGG